MQNGRIAFALLLLAVFTVSTLHAQTSSGPQTRDSQGIPNLSGIWEAPNELNSTFAKDGRSDLCDEGACQSVLEIRSRRLITTVEEPQMLPWAEERFEASRLEGSQRPREDADPWFSACEPFSPTAITLSPFAAFELRQFPDVVLLLFRAGDGSQSVRRIYVDGRGHPENPEPSWNGHSVGHYAGDTLVVDAIRIKGDRWLDMEGYPHSDSLHLVERFRRTDENSLEYEVTITDPTAYKNSWTKKVVRQRAEPGPRFWDSAICEELLQMGTHYGAEARGED